MKRVPKNEFRRRLLRLSAAIDCFLNENNDWDLYPALSSVFALIWCVNPRKELYKDGTSS